MEVKNTVFKLKEIIINVKNQYYVSYKKVISSFISELTFVLGLEHFSLEKKQEMLESLNTPFMARLKRLEHKMHPKLKKIISVLDKGFFSCINEEDLYKFIFKNKNVRYKAISKENKCAVSFLFAFIRLCKLNSESPAYAITKRVKEMDQFYELDLEMVQNLANEIAIDLGPETLQVLVDYLQVTIGIVKPCISSAVVIIYFSMKTGPGTMLNMYYTLTYETQMKGFLTKVINNIEKQYTPIYKMATNYKIAANININDLQNLKFEDNLNCSDFFNKYKKEIAMAGSGVAAVTFTICGIKYFMLSPEIMEDKSLALQWIGTLKETGAIYAYALSDAVGTIAGSARSGAIDGFLQGIVPEVKKVGTALGELVSSFEKARNK